MAPPTTPVSRPFIQVMTGEATVAAASQEADTAADRLGALFDAHHQRLLRLARRLSRNADDARDLVQETFLRAARRPSAVPWGPPDEEAWLVRVLVNLCRDRWRRQSTRKRLDPVMDPTRKVTDPEPALEARSIVWHALGTLDPRRRAILVLHELEGAPIEAVAKLLGVAAVTVRWHLAKGRRQLADVIKGVRS